MKVWSKGVVRDEPVEINSLNYSLHYATPCVWEGIRSYLQADGATKIFKLKAHVDRLFDSAKIINVQIPFSKEEVVKACQELVIACGGGDLYLRPVVYSSILAENAKPQAQEIQLDIYAFPIKSLHSDKDGIKVGISSFHRGYPQFQMQAKTSANYSVLQIAKHEMKDRGLDDILLTDNNGYITEATVANIFVFKGDKAFTPPNDGSILKGITRECVIEILQNAKLSVEEKKITRADLYTADCIILCGTYAEIVNVKEVDGRLISVNSPYFNLVKSRYQRWTSGK